MKERKKNKIKAAAKNPLHAYMEVGRNIYRTKNGFISNEFFALLFISRFIGQLADQLDFIAILNDALHQLNVRAQ